MMELRKSLYNLTAVACFLGCHTACSPLPHLPQQQDFEAGLPAGWTTDSKAVSVTRERAYSGERSLKISGKAGSGRHYLSYDLRRLPQPADQLYGAAMVYLDKGGSGGDFTLVQAEGAPRPESGAPADISVMYRARIDGRHDHLMANYDTRGKSAWNTDCWKQPAFGVNTPPAAEYRLPAGQWVCLRWHFDAINNRLAYWLNDKPLTQIEVNGSGDGCIGQDQQGRWYGPAAFERLHLGMEQYHADAGARTLYLDDIAVDTRPVDCPGADSH
jgi:hypothetical protein